jgi:outer membrane protein TolC
MLHSKRHSGKCHRVSRLLAVLLMAGTLMACASAPPVPGASQTVLQQAIEDKLLAQAGVEPITEAIGLEEAMARALKFNLERRVRMMEETIALRQWDVTQLDKLPRVLAQAGYQSRNNDATRLSRDADGTLVPSGQITQERRHNLGELGLSWSLLDYGMAHYNSLQQAERFQVAVEKRRKAMHLLMQDVRVAFWRAASAQKMQTQVARTIQMAEDVLKDAQTVESARIRNPVESVRYQRQLLENLRQLEAVAQELATAQLELASLINAPLGQTLSIAEPPNSGLDGQWLQTPVERLEELAMEFNADIRQQHHNARDTRLEARKTLLRLYPNLNFNYSLQRDSDSYLINNRWNQVGLQLSFNLLNLLAYPAQKQLAEAAVALADQRRVTAQAAVLAQVHLSRLQLAQAMQQFNRARQIHETEQRLADLVSSRENAQLQSRMDRISSDTGALLSLLRRYQALSVAQAAQARLAATVGAEPEVGSVDSTPLPELIRQVSQGSRGPEARP